MGFGASQDFLERWKAKSTRSLLHSKKYKLITFSGNMSGNIYCVPFKSRKAPQEFGHLLVIMRPPHSGVYSKIKGAIGGGDSDLEITAI